MLKSTLDMYIGTKVSIEVKYGFGTTSPHTVSQVGWLLKNKYSPTYTVAFFDKNSNLTYLAVQFTASEVTSLYRKDYEKLDMSLVLEDFRTHEPKQVTKQEDINAGMTKKGPYQTSGMNWL